MSSYFNEGEQKTANDIHSDSLSNTNFKNKMKIYYSSIRDKIIVYKAARWSIIAVFFIIYLIRILN